MTLVCIRSVRCYVETGKGFLPIEVKSSDRVSHDMTSGLYSFSRRFGVKSGLVLYTGEMKEQQAKNIKITFIPVWDFLADMDAYL